MKIINETISQLTVPTAFAGDTHIYLIKGDTLSLVDAGIKTKEAWEALKFQLKQLGYSPNDIEQIILTHHHPDHTGLIDHFPRVENIGGHPKTDLWIQKNESFFQHYENFFKEYFSSCSVPSHFDDVLKNLRAPLQYAGEGELTVTLHEGDLLPGHGEWQVIDTKGHAQSHLSFYKECDGTFIGGDHLLQHISTNPLLEPPYEAEKERPKPLIQYRANLKKCLSLGISTVLPGHGPLFSNVGEIISSRLGNQEKRADKVHLMLVDQAHTPFQVCQKLYPTHYDKQLELTMSQTIGQLDFLEEQNKVEQFVVEGVIYYQAKK